MNLETPAEASGGDFVTYDELDGPNLDEARWGPARLPLPTGGDHIPLDPAAAVAVGDAKSGYRSPANLAVDLAVNNIGGDPGDFRQGIAAFHVFDFDVSKRVFAVCGTSTRVLADCPVVPVPCPRCQHRGRHERRTRVATAAAPGQQSCGRSVALVTKSRERPRDLVTKALSDVLDQGRFVCTRPGYAPMSRLER